MFDVCLLLLVGLLGYVLRKLDFQLAPMVVGLVLGPLIEKHLREGMFMSLGEVSVFYSSPIALFIWVLVLLVLCLNPLAKLWGRLFGIKTKPIVAGGIE
jgi:putative tricarboxylic transport membrane protein